MRLATAVRFHVTLDDLLIPFTGCSGLGARYEVTEWREGGDNGTVMRLAGRLSYSDVTLTRPVDEHSGTLAQWFAGQFRTPLRRQVKIVLSDSYSSNPAPLAVWTLDGAWPLAYTGPSLSTTADGEVVAVESLVLSHLGYTT
jgi:phage tail-like protein